MKAITIEHGTVIMNAPVAERMAKILTTTLQQVAVRGLLS